MDSTWLRLAGFFLASTQVPCQQPWPVRVLDLATGQGIANVMVTGRTSGNESMTDANGEATLMVDDADESVLVHGNSGYNYTTGVYPHNRPQTFWLVPNSAFHKTGVIPVGGTPAPIVFQGVTQCCLGPNAYTLEIEVPAGVLPEPADFWIAPVPAYASPSPMGADAAVNGAIAQFAIELRDATGKELNKALPDPGIIVRFSPTWYPYSMIGAHTQQVDATQYRLTYTSQQWEAQPDKAFWNPTSGMFECHLRGCSWWFILPFVPFLAGDSHPPAPSNPPPTPTVNITKSECMTTSQLSASFVTCGVVSGGPITASCGQNGKYTFGAGLSASMAASLGIAPSQLAQLITRINASLSMSAQLNADGEITVDVEGSGTATIPNGSSAGPNTLCYSGEARIAVYSQPYTLQVGTSTFNWAIPRGIVKTYCLTLDSTCGEQCNTGPYKKDFTLPSSIKLCDGDPAKCQ